MTIHHINPATTRLVRVARRMEAELQDFVDDAESGGSHLPFVQALLDEWRSELRASGYVSGVRNSKTMPKIITTTEETAMQEIIGKYVIVRTYSAGVHAGTLASKKGKEVVLTNARRIWYWSGAASLSQLAVDGTSEPNKCKFPVSVGSILLTEAIEIIPCTDNARQSIESVQAWKS